MVVKDGAKATPTTPSTGHGTRSHALCSASGASRWLNCLGSVGLCTKVPPRPTSIYALEGTRAHELAEVFLGQWQKGGAFEAQGFEPDMIAHVKGYIEFVKTKSKEFSTPPTIRIEKQVTLHKDLSMWGTADVVMIGERQEESHGKIIDFKYGKTRVVAKDNPQLAYYGAALVQTAHTQAGVNLKTVEVCIYQPRVVKGVTAIEYSHAELMAWHGVLTSGAEKAMYQVIGIRPPEYTLGTWCKWCDGKTICPEFNKPPEEGAGQEFL